MPDGGSAHSSPTAVGDAIDLQKTPGYPIMTGMSPTAYTPTSGSMPSASSVNYNGQPFVGGSGFGYSSASSFSSTSGSISGGSFSSTDALPAISRNFVRPSTLETRRPVTAGAALQTRSPFGAFLGENDKPQRSYRSSSVMAEDGRGEAMQPPAGGMFNNPDPFAASIKEVDEDRLVSVEQAGIDPRYVPPSRQPSGPHVVQSLNSQTSWATVNPQQPSAPQQPNGMNPSTHAQLPLTSAPAHVTNFNLFGGMGQSNHIQSVPRAGWSFSGRPQTSDGLPSYGNMGNGGVSLPSARTIVNQIDPSSGITTQPQTFYPASSSFSPYRDNRAASMGNVHSSVMPNPPVHRHFSVPSDKGRPGFISAAMRDGQPVPTELTFVPLGGPAPKKRPRRRYDEIERLYVCGWNGCEKSYGTLNHLNAHAAMQKHGEKRLPTEFKDMRKAWRKKKREQATSNATSAWMSQHTSGWHPSLQRGSMSSSESDFDRRDSGTTTYSSDYSHRGSFAYQPPEYSHHPGVAGSEARPDTSSSTASSADGRLQAPYNHTMINTIPSGPRRPSGPGPLNLPPQATAFRGNEGDHPTPTQQNPNPFATRPGSGHGPTLGGGEPNMSFSSFTSAMNVSTAPYGSQFAFNR